MSIGLIMEIFEHLSLIPFLLIAMSIVRLVESIGKIIHHQQEGSNCTITLYWVHGVFLLILFIAQAAFWWNSFDFNATGRIGKQVWHLGEYGLYLIPCVLLYLLAELSFPHIDSRTTEIDLRKHYYSQSREIFLLCTVHALLVGVQNSVFFGIPLASANLPISTPLEGWRIPL